MNSAFGFLQSGLAPCSSAEEHPKLFDACLYFVANGLHRDSTIGVELSHGAPRLKARKMCDSLNKMTGTRKSVPLHARTI